MPRRVVTCVLVKCLVGATSISLSATPAAAQDVPAPAPTRAQMLGAAREALMRESSPPARSTIERGLYWFDNQHVLAKVAAGWKGFRVGGGDLPAGAGLTFGGAYDRILTTDADSAAPNQVAVAIRGAYSSRGYRRVAGSVTLRDLCGRPVHAEMFGRYYEHPQEDYFGIGMDSLETNRTSYRLEAVEAGGAVHWKPRKLDFGGGVSLFRPRAGRGSDRRYASIDDVFASTSTPGMGSGTRFVRWRASASFDGRDNPSYPRSGGKYDVVASRFDDRDQDVFDFSRLDVHLQHHLPLKSRYRTFAVEAVGAFTTAERGRSVPFHQLPTLGGHNDLRGFRESRYRGENSVLLGLEYRWQAWWALDGALFVDAGTVAPSRRALSLDTVAVSYGVGFRFHSNSATVARLDLAFSREGLIPILRLDHVF